MQQRFKYCQNPQIQLQIGKEEIKRHNLIDVQRSLQIINKDNKVQFQKNNPNFSDKNPILQHNLQDNEMYKFKSSSKQSIFNQDESLGNRDQQWKSSSKTIEVLNSKDDTNMKRQLHGVKQLQRNPILDGDINFEQQQKKNRPESSQPWSHNKLTTQNFYNQDQNIQKNPQEISLKCNQIQFQPENYQKATSNYGLKKLNKDLNYAQ